MIDQDDDGKIRISALGTKIKMDCTCRFIKVHGITGYRRVPDTDPRISTQERQRQE
jgi:hypothetical protein